MSLYGQYKDILVKQHKNILWSKLEKDGTLIFCVKDCIDPEAKEEIHCVFEEDGIICSMLLKKDF